MQVTVLGKKFRSTTGWLNAQMRMIEKTGFIQGDCSGTTPS